MAIGLKPNSAIFKGQLDIDEKGYVVITQRSLTSKEGIFAAGDVSDFRYRQAITAAGQGCMAAIDCLDYLSKE